MRIAFLWRKPSGYFDAELRTLCARGHDVSVMFEQPTPDAPFELRSGPGAANDRVWQHPPTPGDVLEFLERTRAEVVVTASWGVGAYVTACANYTNARLRVVGVDSQWLPTTKQMVGRWTHRRRFQDAFDAAWINGVQQWELVRRLGFASDRVFDHFYCADTDTFRRQRAIEARRSSPFLFVGRFVEEKGLTELVEAHRIYRSTAPAMGRPLRIVGAGSPPRLHDEVQLSPFLDAASLARSMDDAYALVHPAHEEHWGVVLHEAASMELPILTTRATGASSRFLSPGVSGWFAEPSVDSIAAGLTRLDGLSSARYVAMSQASGDLGRLLDLGSWASHFEDSIERISNDNRAAR